MIIIICIWVYYFLLNLSIGAGTLKLISRFANKDLSLRFGLFYQFWFGFAISIGLLQVMSLFLPVSATAFTILSIVALLFAIINYRSVWTKLKSIAKWSITPYGIVSALAVLVILLLVSYSSNKDVTHTDTLLYHYNAVKWARDYPVVPGLANLHSRLGFNSSFFLFAALSETGLDAGDSTHIALAFMMAICLIHWFFIITNTKALIATRIFCLVTSVYLIHQTLSRMDISSLSTDYPMAILTLVFCVALLDKLDHKILLLLPLSAIVIAFKLSGSVIVGLAMVILVAQFLMLRFKDRSERKTGLRIVSVSFVLFCFCTAGFVIRNIFVSGWLVFPFPIGNLHLSWSVPEPYAKDAMAWIKSWPRIPEGASPSTINDNNFFYWFKQWFPLFSRRGALGMLITTLFVLVWAVFQVSSFSKFIYARLNQVLLVLFSIGSIIFWFVSAPDLRFGFVYFYIFLASAIILLYEGSRYKYLLKTGIFILFFIQITTEWSNFIIDRDPRLFTFEQTNQPKLNRVVASPPDQKPELYIYMPAEGTYCGNSPLPCTPYAGGYTHEHRPIRSRVPGDISKGFLPVP